MKHVILYAGARRVAAGSAWLLIAALARPSGALAAPAVAHPNLWPAGPKNVLIEPRVERFVDALMARMTLAEKVGQMIQADISTITPRQAAKYHLGSILAGGNSAPYGHLRAAPAEWLELANAYQRAAAANGSGHVAIPLLLGIDAVHGDARVRGATIFPQNIALGATHDPQLVRKIGRATADEVASTGFNWAFAPTIAVARDTRWGRTYESYSENPRLVARLSAAMVEGLQGKLGTPDYLSADHTVATVKHFIGDGGTFDGRDQGDDLIPEKTLIRVHAAGYLPAIDAGVLTVMASYNSWQGVKMHANKSLLTGVLKGRFGFNGFIIGDWDAQAEIPGCTKFDCPTTINAGLDMIMAPDSWRQIYRNTLAEVHEGVIPEARIDDAVRRILRVKVLANLFTRPPAIHPRTSAGLDVLGDPAHRALARRAVRESLVLLKNDGGVLPLNPKGRILVVGHAAVDIGQQCGGWTIDWQGAHNTNADFPGATSIYAGIRDEVDAAGGVAKYSRNGHYKRKPEAAIVVFGEHPYAEYEGDRETLEYDPGHHHILRIMQRLHRAGVPVVAVFLSGRPMWVNPQLNAADAFVAAWLPGSEGGGIADVLLRKADGRIRHDFSGRLSFSWPATVMPVRFGANGAVRGALFPRGYGLTYEQHSHLGRLSEARHAAPDVHARNVLFAGGRVTSPWSVFLRDRRGSVRMTLPAQISPAHALSLRLDRNGAHAAWSGKGWGELRIAGRAVDLTRRAGLNLALEIRYRIGLSPSSPVELGPVCERPYASPPQAGRGSRCDAPRPPMLDVTQALARTPIGATGVLFLPLRCFARVGALLDRVGAPLTLRTAGRFAFTLIDARFASAPRATSCPAPASPSALTRAGESTGSAASRRARSHRSVQTGRKFRL
ncbi:MAG: 1,4-beta-D-glucan glucohydrolase [Steroidobacteraceae bacterium]|nr:1,4-beta-D-glucan glucohydrolase [Steroidobacteraceae bacterium]